MGDLPNLGGVLNIIVYLVIPMVFLMAISSRMGSYMIRCPFCGYEWEPRGYHSANNPPARCPSCSKRLPRPRTSRTMPVENEYDIMINKFLLQGQAKTTIKAGDNLEDMKYQLDYRIDQRKLRIETLLENHVLYLIDTKV